MRKENFSIKQFLFIVLLAILITSCGTQIKKANISPTPTLDEKIILQESLNQLLGFDNQNVPRLIKIGYDVPERADITITWGLNDYESQASRKVHAQIDATNILQVLEANKTRFVYVILIGIFSTQDEYGNITKIEAINLGFNKSKLDQVNWQEFQYSNIYDLADLAYIADEWK